MYNLEDILNDLENVGDNEGKGEHIITFYSYLLDMYLYDLKEHNKEFYTYMVSAIDSAKNIELDNNHILFRWSNNEHETTFQPTETLYYFHIEQAREYTINTLKDIIISYDSSIDFNKPLNLE